MTAMVADNLRRKAVGDNVTFVINRNINFTNVCIKRCGFCAYSRDFRNEESYFLPTEEVVRRAKEAWDLGATEICIQAGLPPKMDGFLYIDICKAIKKELPNIHIHAFSPEEIMYGSYRSGLSVKEYLRMLKESGLGSLPGTAAEILDQDVRDLISPGRITVADWINVITTAHKLKIPTTSTIMYGHVETMEDRAKHLDLLRSIQKQTNGFTEFVPLSFVHKEAPMYNHNLVKGIAPGPTGQDVIKMHAVSRIMLNNFINNIQVSWVKEGAKMSQLLLETGVNDFGGTLINESISTSAGSEFGQLMRPKEIRSLIQSAGRVPAQRTSVYGIIKVYDEINDKNESLLDSAETTQFGSYHELIKLDKFRYKRTK
jgi:FO synthase subunit 2